MIVSLQPARHKPSPGSALVGVPLVAWVREKVPVFPYELTGKFVLVLLAGAALPGGGAKSPWNIRIRGDMVFVPMSGRPFGLPVGNGD
jgi:hypothetical protein